MVAMLLNFMLNSVTIVLNSLRSKNLEFH